MGDEGKEDAVENLSKFSGTDHEVRKICALEFLTLPYKLFFESGLVAF